MYKGISAVYLPKIYTEDTDMFKSKSGKIAAAVIIAAAIINPEYFFGALKALISALTPIFIGMAAAFVINRPVCRVYELIKRLWSGVELKAGKHSYGLSCRARSGVFSAESKRRKIWLTSVAAVYLLIILTAAAAVKIIIPQLTASLRALVENGDFYRQQAELYYNALESRDKLGLMPMIVSALKNVSLKDIILGAYGKTAGFIGSVADFIIGAVISVYILADKDRLTAVTKKIFRRFLGDETFAKSAEIYRKVYDVFSRFVSGQITEACILGALCFVGMTLLRFDYALLISTVIGVTALIPVAGAIIGTIPCALLLFLSEPMSAVWFIVFIIILQQLENNLIYPRVVGKSMGLPPLPVLLAILLGARLGGVTGILLAVPLTAVIYGVAREKLLGETAQ